jgi:hypothetical protein
MDENHRIHLRFHGTKVCTTAFKLLYGFSNNKYTHALQLTETPYAPIYHGNTANLNAAQHTAHVNTHFWFYNFILANGDYDPSTGHIHIPEYVSHELLYELFIEDHVNENAQLPKERSFQEYIHTHFPHVKFLRHTRLGRCTFCLDIVHKKHNVC